MRFHEKNKYTQKLGNKSRAPFRFNKALRAERNHFIPSLNKIKFEIVGWNYEPMSRGGGARHETYYQNDTTIFCSHNGTKVEKLKKLVNERFLRGLSEISIEISSQTNKQTDGQNKPADKQQISRLTCIQTNVQTSDD